MISWSVVISGSPIHRNFVLVGTYAKRFDINVKGKLSEQVDKFYCQNIRIFNGCKVRIENSVTQVTVRHHKARRVMPNSYPRDGIFCSHPATIMDSFSCVLFLWQSYLSLNMCSFINFILKTTFSIKKCLVRHPSTTSWHHAQGRTYTPSCKTETSRMGDFVRYIPTEISTCWQVQGNVISARKCHLTPGGERQLLCMTSGCLFDFHQMLQRQHCK